MAKATALCTCKYCGSKFEKTTTKRNRSEADSWERWAEDNYVECTSCWGKRKRAEEAETPATAEIKLDPYGKQLIAVVHGNTMPIKDTLKTIGCRWDYEPTSGFLGLLSTTRPRKCWSIIVPIRPDTLENEVDALKSKFEAAGITATVEISGVDLIALRDILAMDQEKADKIAQIEKPEKPICYPSGKWNGRFYGSSRNGWSIYVDGDKVSVTEEQKSEIEKYQRLRSEYKKAIAEIK